MIQTELASCFGFVNEGGDLDAQSLGNEVVEAAEQHQEAIDKRKGRVMELTTLLQPPGQRLQQIAAASTSRGVPNYVKNLA